MSDTDRNSALEEAAKIASLYAYQYRAPPECYADPEQDEAYRNGAQITAQNIEHDIRALSKADEDRKLSDLERCALESRHLWDDGYAAPNVWPNIAAPPQYNPTDGWEDPRLPPFQTIWDIAKAHGYAVGLHGSMKRDVDLIAAPWTETAVSPTVLIEALCASLNARVVGGPEKKPLGRLAATLQIDGWFKPIDISIMPGAPNGTSSNEPTITDADVERAAKAMWERYYKSLYGNMHNADAAAMPDRWRDFARAALSSLYAKEK